MFCSHLSQEKYLSPLVFILDKLFAEILNFCIFYSVYVSNYGMFNYSKTN